MMARSQKASSLRVDVRSSSAASRSSLKRTAMRPPTTGAMPWQYPSDVFKHE
jgi:hypothetical protein